MRRLGALLRRLADRIDPVGATASPAAPEAPGAMIAITREQLREVEREAIEGLCGYTARAPGDGLLWVPSGYVNSLRWLLGIELEARASDFAAVERDPTVRLR